VRIQILLAVSLLLGAPSVFANPIGPDGWEQISDKEGVMVFRRNVPGSPLKSMKGVGVVNAPVAKVALVLLDDARAPEWVDSLAEARVVRTLSPYDYIEYNHIAMPPLIRDREFITHVIMSIDRATRAVIMRSDTADDPSIPKNKKIIRGDLTAYYVLKSIDGDQHTQLSIELHSDPKGLLPAWVVNLFQKDWARITIRGIRNQVQKPDLKVPPEFAQFLHEADFTAAPAQH
jgi:hypothetical protein